MNKSNIFTEDDYEVAAKTGEVSGAGTDASVFLRVIGDGGDTGNLSLGDGSSHFDTGSTDTFNMTTTSTGEVRLTINNLTCVYFFQKKLNH